MFIIVIISFIVNIAIRLDVNVLVTYSSEDSFTEYSQLLFIIITIFIYIRLIFERKDLKHALVLISGFFTVILIRELDSLFDLVYHGFWEVPAISVTLLSCYYAFRNYKTGLNELVEILNSNGMKLLITAVMILFVYSRLFGMASLWKEVLGVRYIYQVKTIAEEGTELLAYCLIAFSSYLIRKSLINKN